MGQAVLEVANDLPQGPTFRERVAAARPPAFWSAITPRARLSEAERAGLLRIAGFVPGTCSEAKIHALMEVMRHAPQGDVVEIGSACGRSATLLLLLSQRFGLGKVLCVDPCASAAPQDVDEMLRMFEVNLAPLAQGRLNYAPTRADAFALDYGPGLAVQTEVFGATAYEGAIGVLHIDGGQAQRLCDLWAGAVVGGGWLIFGDGGQAAADAFAEANRDRLSARFTAGGSQFLQLKRNA